MNGLERYQCMRNEWASDGSLSHRHWTILFVEPMPIHGAHIYYETARRLWDNFIKNHPIGGHARPRETYGSFWISIGIDGIDMAGTFLGRCLVWQWSHLIYIVLVQLHKVLIFPLYAFVVVESLPTTLWYSSSYCVSCWHSRSTRQHFFIVTPISTITTMPKPLKHMPFSIKAVVAELLATAMFVYIGTGTWHNGLTGFFFISRVSNWIFMTGWFWTPHGWADGPEI